ncbi:hypothetical protein BCR41DRAFT_351395 [Lobosporangium transversale]|uniref:Uncharacterized protein n=1 Tax=Lobosporangium transversale TaxID=64571 RepID=A0A1Y2GRL8_9FUNG|nr:hypothetical protein BCR41DRAFT_351395 [Lobosporangium transversale]ORZ20174.1 hypothetical protein BCR41DRAFT_351395 [Lobosporangium transversale]|eukprot:XP_021882714.1 hypothetical protein BCR41DRAFT_351395 [Lobosporangium transversale]
MNTAIAAVIENTRDSARIRLMIVPVRRGRESEAGVADFRHGDLAPAEWGVGAKVVVIGTNFIFVMDSV